MTFGWKFGTDDQSNITLGDIFLSVKCVCSDFFCVVILLHNSFMIVIKYLLLPFTAIPYYIDICICKYLFLFTTLIIDIECRTDSDIPTRYV